MKNLSAAILAITMLTAAPQFLFATEAQPVVADAQPVPWQSTPAEIVALAHQYNQYLNDNNIDEAMKLVAKDVIFVDFTWDGNEVTGRKNLRQIFSANSNSIHNSTLDVRRVMTSRGTVVIHAILSGDMDLVENGSAEDRMHGITDIIRIFTFKNGKIIRHIDLLDYDRFMPEIALRTANLKK